MRGVVAKRLRRLVRTLRGETGSGFIPPGTLRALKRRHARPRGTDAQPRPRRRAWSEISAVAIERGKRERAERERLELAAKRSAAARKGAETRRRRRTPAARARQ